MNYAYFSALIFVASSLHALTWWHSHPALKNLTARPPIHASDFSNSEVVVYDPNQIRHAYGFDQLPFDGTGQKIAIVDAYGSPTIQQDLDIFSAEFGLPSTTIQIYYPDGYPTSSDPSWEAETTLDVEWAHAIAPGATILLVISPDAYNEYLFNAVQYAIDLGAKQISLSWGSYEFPGEVLFDSIFNVPNVSVVVAAGDSHGVQYPSSSPYVISVGGTTLTLDAAGNVISEVPWGQSGGGVSAYEPEPAYQLPFQSSNMRMVPDICYNADPNTAFWVYITSRGWGGYGGTSVGTPQWAALIALMNSMTYNIPTDQVNNLLYRLGRPSIRSLYFRDVNGVYAEDTGLGSPHSNFLVPALAY